MDSIKKTIKFAKNLNTTGAIFETSKKAENEVSKYVSNKKPQSIVEFGAGLGNITRTILAKMHPDSKLYVFEINEEFCSFLRSIDDTRLIVVNCSAEFLENYVPDKVDCIISSIPFSFIPTETLKIILDKSRNKLKDDGQMSQILYSTYHLKKYRRFFQHVSYKVILGLPLEFVYHCSN